MTSYRHNHIVTRAYLERFTSEGLITCGFVDGGEARDLGTSAVAVRSGFYLELRRDGTRSPRFEQAMGPIESKGVEALRALDGAWPLPPKIRGDLAAFIGLQVARGPGWRAWFEEARRASFDKRRRRVSDEEALRVLSGSDEFRLDLMLGQINKLGTLIGSMHWTLVRFAGDRILTSDQPLAAVPLPTAKGAIPNAVPVAGFANTLEFYLPLDPRAALVMTWLDEPEHGAPVTGKLHWARNINAPLRHQADKHWFKKPG